MASLGALSEYSASYPVPNDLYGVPVEWIFWLWFKSDPGFTSGCFSSSASFSKLNSRALSVLDPDHFDLRFGEVFPSFNLFAKANLHSRPHRFS